jgi:hypothetical protein
VRIIAFVRVLEGLVHNLFVYLIVYEDKIGSQMGGYFPADLPLMSVHYGDFISAVTGFCEAEEGGDGLTSTFISKKKKKNN